MIATNFVMLGAGAPYAGPRAKGEWV